MQQEEMTFDFYELVTLLGLLNRQIEKIVEYRDFWNTNEKWKDHYSRKFQEATSIKRKVRALAMELDTSDADVVKCSLSNSTKTQST